MVREHLLDMMRQLFDVLALQDIVIETTTFEHPLWNQCHNNKEQVGAELITF